MRIPKTLFVVACNRNWTANLIDPYPISGWLNVCWVAGRKVPGMCDVIEVIICMCDRPIA